MSIELSDEDPSALLRRLEPTCTALASLTKISLRGQGLSALPAALSLCMRLEHLDIGGNTSLCALDGVERLPSLKVLFVKGCPLGPKLPIGGPLSQAASLFMLGIGDVGLVELDGAALPPSLGWLIAPQNAISAVRNTSRLSGVRKLMLSHNLLDAFAAEKLLEAIPGLEMLRLACNRLETLPPAIFAHPRLAWLAVGGNPCSQRAQAMALAASAPTAENATTAFLPDASEVEVSDALLGQGSGALVKRGTWRGQPVAVKLWSAEKFSDGDARGEWAAGRLTGGCPDLVRTLAAWEAPALGMALELLEGASAVGAPPDFESVTRDTFVGGRQPKLTLTQALNVAVTVARAGAWLHEHGLMHGDIYLHNTLRVAAAETKNDIVRLSDFGAACAYDRAQFPLLEKVEVRSFGWLVEDLLSWIAPERSGEGAAEEAVDPMQAMDVLRNVANACSHEELERVPSFTALLAALDME